MDLEFQQSLLTSSDATSVLLVLDGLGGLPREEDSATELEAAHTPHLDRLAKEGVCGLQVPVGPGITPGSGPGHLSLFGYDPIEYQVGRGVLSALGIGFDLGENDVAARGNFCTLDQDGKVIDRRAGRISTEKNEELCAILKEIELPGVEVFVETVKEHRLLLVIRGEELTGGVNDTDPQQTGVPPRTPKPDTPNDEHTAELIQQFLTRAREKLADHHPANMVLLRGFAKRPAWPKFGDVYGVRAAAVAGYPMYRGVSRLVGMDVLEVKDDISLQIEALRNRLDDYDFFYVHVKRIDSAGEDGDFERKKRLIEEVDEALPELLDLGPDVLAVTGDHSTPSRMKYHSWHPVPLLIHSDVARRDPVNSFGESACLQGGLGPRLPGKSIMPLIQAQAGRLTKFGA